MTTFDERLHAFEAKFIHDQEVQFRVFARRDHLLGLWAGEILNLTDDELAHYSLTVVAADLEERGDDDVLRKVAEDFRAAEIKLTDVEIRAKMEELLIVAKQQIAIGS